MQTISTQTCFNGVQGFYSHQSDVTGTEMRFAVFLPPQAKKGPVPAIYYLAGLTCNEETATIKAGAQRMASELGLALIMPDTSPRGANIPGEDADWDFGSGAGFYLNATEQPWAKNYRMYSYITEELRELINSAFPVDPDACGIFGHSMGGHGALTIALKQAEIYKSVSAFAPICAPMHCPWGQKAFTNYLGTADKAAWGKNDASELVRIFPTAHHILIDQGEDDQFLETELNPDLFKAACKASGQELTYRSHPGYDHSYYFIQSFMADHLQHHAKILKAL